MAQAKFPSHVAQRIFSLLDDSTNKLALFGQYGSVFYGDQTKIPTTPTVCIEAGETRRPMSAAVRPGGMVENQFECYILVYHAKVQSAEANKLESEQIAEAVVQFLDANLTLLSVAGDDPLVIHGWCVSIDPGYAFKEGTLFESVRITWNGITKTRLGA
jgi:hypothetical protein